jgi:hypothetical protein
VGTFAREDTDGSAIVANCSRAVVSAFASVIRYREDAAEFGRQTDCQASITNLPSPYVINNPMRAVKHPDENRRTAATRPRFLTKLSECPVDLMLQFIMFPPEFAAIIDCIFFPLARFFLIVLLFFPLFCSTLDPFKPGLFSPPQPSVFCPLDFQCRSWPILSRLCTAISENFGFPQLNRGKTAAYCLVGWCVVAVA